jgi:hypothetical protein
MVLPTSTSWIAAEQHKATKKKEAIITAACAFGNSLTLVTFSLCGSLSASIFPYPFEIVLGVLFAAQQ